MQDPDQQIQDYLSLCSKREHSCRRSPIYRPTRAICIGCNGGLLNHQVHFPLPSFFDLLSFLPLRLSQQCLTDRRHRQHLEQQGLLEIVYSFLALQDLCLVLQLLDILVLAVAVAISVTIYGFTLVVEHQH